MRVSVRGGAGRAWLGALLAVGLLMVQGVAQPLPARAADPVVTYSSSVTYDVRPANGIVHATAMVSADAAADAKGFWDGITISVPPGSKNFAAFAGTKPLGLRLQSQTATEVAVAVSFGRHLFPGQTFAFQLQFDITDDWSGPGREIRITRTVASFPVFALCSTDVKGSTVTVRFPPGYDVTQDAGQLMRGRDTETGVVYTSGLTGDRSLFSWFTAETKPTMVPRSIQVGPLALTIVSFDDDPLWAYQVETLVRGGYPVLRDDIGLGDVELTPLRVEEMTAAESSGLSGSYDMATNTIHLSYDADPSTLLHEMAHLWLNPRLVSDPWISEGFASYYAEQALAELDVPGHPPVLNDRKMASRIPLAGWSPPDGLPTIQDEYAYAASLEAAREIAASASQDGLRRVWQRIARGPVPYQPPRGPVEGSKPVAAPDWGQFLDYLEDTVGDGAAGSFESIWQEWVLDPYRLSQLEQHADVRKEYAELVAAAGSWSVPAEVRESLRSWNLVRAENQLGSLRDVLEARAQIEAGVAAERTTAPPSLRTAFETGVAAAVREANGEMRALDLLTQARIAQEQASRNGAPAPGPTDQRVQALAEARAAFANGQWQQAGFLADSVRTAWQQPSAEERDRVTTTGAAMAGVVVAAFIAAVVVVPYLTRRRRRPAVRAVAGDVDSLDVDRASRSIREVYMRLGSAEPPVARDAGKAGRET